MALAAGTQVPAVVCPYRTQSFPAFLRMHQDITVFCLVKIQNCRQDLILYLDTLQGLKMCIRDRCSICPVNLSKASLSYNAQTNNIDCLLYTSFICSRKI